MSSYIILIFVPIVVYCFYLFWKTKLDLYLLLGAIGWYGMFYWRRFGLYSTMQEPFKSMVNFITVLLVLQLFVSYFKKIIQEYMDSKEEKNS